MDDTMDIINSNGVVHFLVWCKIHTTDLESAFFHHPLEALVGAFKCLAQRQLEQELLGGNVACLLLTSALCNQIIGISEKSPHCPDGPFALCGSG